MSASPAEGELELEIGTVGIAFSGLYYGADTQYEGFPLAVIRYKDFYFEGLLAGYRLYRDQRISVAIETIPTLYDYESGISDFLDGMDDRKMAWETGLSVDYTLDRGKLSMKLVRDWQGIHDGWSLSAEYGESLLMTERSLLIGYMGGEYLDPNKSDYYYGVRKDEARSWRPAYEVGGALAASVGLSHIYRLGEKTTLMSNVDYKHFSTSITDSPIVEKHYQLSAYAGILYKIH